MPLRSDRSCVADAIGAYQSVFRAQACPRRRPLHGTAPLERRSWWARRARRWPPARSDGRFQRAGLTGLRRAVRVTTGEIIRRILAASRSRIRRDRLCIGGGVGHRAVPVVRARELGVLHVPPMHTAPSADGSAYAAGEPPVTHVVTAAAVLVSSSSAVAGRTAPSPAVAASPITFPAAVKNSKRNRIAQAEPSTTTTLSSLLLCVYARIPAYVPSYHTLCSSLRLCLGLRGLGVWPRRGGRGLKLYLAAAAARLRRAGRSRRRGNYQVDQDLVYGHLIPRYPVFLASKSPAYLPLIVLCFASADVRRLWTCAVVVRLRFRRVSGSPCAVR